MMSISTWERVDFWMNLLNDNSLTHQTWSSNRYKPGQYFLEIFWMIWRTRAKFQALFILTTSSNYSVTNYVKFPVFHFFERVNKENYKWQMLISKNWQIFLYCHVYCHVIKIKKGPGTSFSVSKNLLEIFVKRYTSIWQNFILIVLRIEKT